MSDLPPEWPEADRRERIRARPLNHVLVGSTLGAFLAAAFLPVPWIEPFVPKPLLTVVPAFVLVLSWITFTGALLIGRTLLYWLFLRPRDDDA